MGGRRAAERRRDPPAPEGAGGEGQASAEGSDAKGDANASQGATSSRSGPGKNRSNGAAAQEAADCSLEDVEALERELERTAKAGGDVAEAKPSVASDEPDLAPPPSSRANWAAEMEMLHRVVQDASIETEEKIRLLHEALVQRIEDTRAVDDHKVVMVRRLEDAAKERDRFRSEVQRTMANRTKLEESCRELQQQNMSISKENQRIAEEEQNRHTELKDKFTQAIKDVQEKMDAELEVRQHFLRENEELRGKLLKFTETYEAQEKQLAEQREARGSEMEVAQERLKEHETMCSESKAKTASLEKQNEVLRKSQAVLRDELQAILGKFDEFHEAVTGSNQRHGECKTEIDSLQGRLQDLEKENAELRKGERVTELSQEVKVTQKQRDALERLCDNLNKENKKLQDQLRGLSGG